MLMVRSNRNHFTMKTPLRSRINEQFHHLLISVDEWLALQVSDELGSILCRINLGNKVFYNSCLLDILGVIV